MIWTGRFQTTSTGPRLRCSCTGSDRWGKIHRLWECESYCRYFTPLDWNDSEQYWRDRWIVDVYGRPQWHFPMMRKDHLAELLIRRGQGLSDNWTADFSEWEWRGFQYSYYDLRIVARFAPRPEWPSMWRCGGCGQKMMRSEWTRRVETRFVRHGEAGWIKVKQRPLDCSPECREIALKRQDRQWRREEKRRKKEWEGIVKSRKLIKTVRKLLKDPEYLAACRSLSKESKPARTSPPS